jgi:hypothetical protein
MRNIDDATFLFLQKQDIEKKLREKSTKRPRYNLVRVKKGGKCGTKKEDVKHKKEGWIKVGCGMWTIPVEVD